MKQLIIFLLVVIAGLLAYSLYNTHTRYNSPKVDYEATSEIDLEYYNQGVVQEYYAAVENLNAFVMTQWTANSIDVRTPKDDDSETQNAVNKYTEILGRVKYLETKLSKSKVLKDKGMTNASIKQLEKTGLSSADYVDHIRRASVLKNYDAKKSIYFGQKSPLVYEVQRQLKKHGFDIKVDGNYHVETQTAVKLFEEKNNLYVDGLLDETTLAVLFGSN